ncbi:MAG: PAS domain-containing protein [Candidatus Weimeria sp.]
MEGEFHFNKQEKKYLTSFPGMLVVFQVLDDMDRVILASDVMLETLNFTYDELVTYFINGSKPLIKYTSLDGATRYFEGKAIPQKRKHATLKYVTYADVTEVYSRLDSKEKDASGEENFYKSIIENSVVPIFWKDKNRKFKGANKAFLDAYGFKSVSDIIGKTDEDMGWHTDPEKFKAIEEKVLQGEKSGPDCTKNLIQGRQREIVATKSPLYDKNGEIVGLVGSFFDITDRNE